MLVKRPLEINDIVAVKLVSGEELIGKLVSLPNSGSKRISLTKPIVLGMQQQQNPTTGQLSVGLGFGPFMLGISDDETVELEEHAYLTFSKARDEVKNAYLKSTTGLEVPPSSLVV